MNSLVDETTKSSTVIAAIMQDTQTSRAVSQIFDAIGSRRFLRSPLAKTAQLVEVVKRCISSDEPLRILLLWGKGHKACPDRAEHLACDFLYRYAKAIEAAWNPGVLYSVLFADTHAIANGHDPGESSRYFDSVRSILSPLCYSFNSLSCVWQDAGLNLSRVRMCAQTFEETFEMHWDAFAEQFGLISAAGRHSRSSNPEQAARLYAAMRILENRIISRVFNGFLYATSEHPSRELLFPNLPILSIYSTARGRCAKPWFTEMPMDSDLRNVEASEQCVE